jgi:Protein of unknown function (DUF2793)
MTSTPRLSLPYLQPNQAQKHVTLNDSLSLLDMLVQLSVQALDEASEPTNPAEGDCYILPDDAIGEAWASLPARSVVCFQDGNWVARAPQAGWRAFVEATGALIVFNGTDWREPVQAVPASRFGINAWPDEINRLAVGSAGALFTHDGDDHRLAINKAAAADTASVVFQTGFSGRAETGLTGDENWHLKVSPDGAVWHESLMANRETGEVVVANGLVVAPGKPIRTPETPLNTPDDAALELEGGGGLGRVALVLKSVGGLTGALFEQRSTHPANIDLIDFGLKTLSRQINLRVEARTPFAITGAPEFQIGDSGDGTQPIQALFAVSQRAASCLVPFQLPAMTVAELPTGAAASTGSLVFVTNDAGGAVIAFHDGAVWRRLTDRAPVQA